MSTEADRVDADSSDIPEQSASTPLPSLPSQPLAPLAPIWADPPPAPTRSRRRAATAAVCLMLGLGALAGAAVGTWANRGPDIPAEVAAYDRVRELWHAEPVDTLFPRTLRGDDAGPGGSDRTWTRIAVAPDSDCAGAFDPALAKALAPVGCERLLRATYTDATGSSVITVGLVFAKAGPEPMRRLVARFDSQKLATRPEFLPLPFAAKGTEAARFGAEQRASWTLAVLSDAPVVVYAVSGFADGRVTSSPQPAAQAMKDKQTTPVAQSGLGHAAQGVADGIEQRLRQRIAAATPEDDR